MLQNYDCFVLLVL